MSMAVLEAMAWGLPVVTTASGGADEFLLSGRNCLLTKPGDIPELAAAMSALARDPQLRVRLGAEARKTASGFRVELCVEKLTGLYEELARPARKKVRTQPEFTAKQDLPSAPAPALQASRKLRSW
jgi:glycosyltransferase involved in cell wall biosynthesis